MKRIFHAFLFFILAIPLTEVPNAHSQTGAARIVLLDRTGRETTSIVDGNRVQLRMEWPAVLTEETRITFVSSGIAGPIGECTIQAGADACETSPFHALGWYWNADGSVQPQRTITTDIPVPGSIGRLIVSIAPRPVVMVHGFNSNYQTWKAYLGPQGYLAELGLQGFAVGDGQASGVMETGSAADPFKRTNTVAENAVILGEYIDHVRQATGAEKVDLLVHSMGGIISRYYIDRLMTEDDVAQLIALGPPMGGSACSILPAALGIMLPATLELQPSYMLSVFNQQIVRRKGVPFYALAGTKLLDEVTSPCTPVPSDVVVTLDSVRAISMPVEEIALLHTELTTSRQVFDGFVTRRLKTQPGEFELAADPPSDPNTPISQQFSRVYTGHLNPGKTQEVAINIDPNVMVANFALFDTSRSLNILVTGASGQRLELDAIENGIIRIDNPSTLVYLGYSFKQPRPGRWVVTLQTTASTPASGADYAIAAQFHGGALLQATQDITAPRLNETVTITAVLTVDGVALPLTSAVAIIHAPDGSTESLEMAVSDTQAELKITPGMPGIHGIEINTLANSAEGNIIDRAAFLTFDAQATRMEIAKNQIVAVILIVSLITVSIVFIRRRKRVLQGRAAS